MDTIPWTLKPEHMNSPEARLLRLEARVRRGLDLNPNEMTWWSNWRKELEEKGAVITYRPETEQGWWWIPRTEDDDDIIRRPATEGE